MGNYLDTSTTVYEFTYDINFDKDGIIIQCYNTCDTNQPYAVATLVDKGVNTSSSIPLCVGTNTNIANSGYTVVWNGNADGGLSVSYNNIGLAQVASPPTKMQCGSVAIGNGNTCSPCGVIFTNLYQVNNGVRPTSCLPVVDAASAKDLFKKHWVWFLIAGLCLLAAIIIIILLAKL